MALTEDEVLKILELIEKSEFDFLELELGDLKLVVKKGGSVERTSRQGPATGEVETDLEGLLPITAPTVGTFYVAPQPGATPFVTEGTRVDEDTPVGLIEIMKVFSSVRAGVRGTVSRILVANAQRVEYGQILFLVKPD